MLKFENYLPNIDVNDKYGIKDVIIGKNMSASVRFINIANKGKQEPLKVDYGSRPLAAAVLGVNNTSASSDHSVPRIPELHQSWTDIDEQQLYVDTKPNCYFIIGKPGTGAYSLGEVLAKELNTIHICPRNVILEEVAQKSPTGKCLHFNMKNFNPCKFNTILSIIISKMNSPAVKHRGYVISGIPLVTTSRSEMIFFKRLHSEETVLLIQELLYDFVMNLRKKKKNRKPGSETDMSEATFPKDGGEANEEHEEEEEEQVPEEAEEEDAAVELPPYLLEPCENLVFSTRHYYDSKKVTLMNQFNEILKTQLRPDIYIYITCPDEDVVTIKNHKYLDYSTEAYIVDPFLSTSINTEERWPPKSALSDDHSIPFSDSNVKTKSKYHVIPPINYTENVINHLCNYRNIILPLWEKKIKDINPKYIIKVDARTSVHSMLYHIKQRLEVLPLVKRVILPEPLCIQEPPDEIDEFWSFVEESNVVKYNNVTFNRYASPWYARCPVELNKRKSVRGNPKYAVSFFKHVFLMSSLDALLSFWKDPRPYLHYQYLEPTCRMVVMGTKSSGKTMVATCLSWLFDTPIITYESVVGEEKEKRYNSVAESVFSEIIPTIEDARYEKWQNLEYERIANLEEWHNTALSNLKKYKNTFSEVERLGASAPPKLLTNLRSLEIVLSFLPFLDDSNQCAAALSRKDIKEYAPASLVIPPEKPRAPVLGDPDVTTAIAAYIDANELQKDIDLNPEAILHIFKSIINSIDEKADAACSTYGKYIIDGFSTDPELWSLLSDAKLLPDHTIVIMENREIDKELMEHYNKVENTIKFHQERYLLANDPLIIIKHKTYEGDLKSDFSNKEIIKIVNDTVHDTIRNMNIEHPDTENLIAEEINSFTQSIESFRVNWESDKPKLEEKYKSIIEVELDAKTDVEVLEEIILKLRQAYCAPCEPFEGDEVADLEDEAENMPRDMLTFNDSRQLCETGIYCPIAYFDYGVLWEGKAEFSIKYANKMHYFSKEECVENFRKDITKYQFYNNPFKNVPSLRICVMGGVGSGKTTISKFIAKELGLMHIDYEEAVNNLLMPRHFKKVGRHYENSFTDVSLDEEAVEAFQLDEETESLITDVLYNEKEMRRMIYNYFEKGTPLLSVLVQKLIKKLWFENPFLNTGIVIDGFPKCPQDVEDMVISYCIPDLVLELESSSVVSIERLSPSMLKTWKMQQNEAKRKAKKKIEEQKLQWNKLITKHVVAILICDDILSEVINVTEISPPIISSKQSKIVENEQEVSPDADPNEPETEPYIQTVYNQVVEQYPEPVDISQWENADEVQERIDGRIESIYEFDDENIQSLKDILSEQKIKITSVDATKSISKVQRKALSKLTNLRTRGALFEQTWVIDCETAEALLQGGFCFLSKFSRMCPVYIYENPHPLSNPYKVSKHKGILFPVVHRCYVYYINTKESLIKFRTDPFKYIMSDNILSFHPFPLRLAVIGPPKSGKSILAAKLSKHFGLICLSKGMAIRNVLENMHWTKLATKIDKTLRNGDCIDYDHIIKAVQTALIDYRSAVHGFVLDGFPDRPPDAMELDKYGIYPLIVFDLSTSKEKLLDNSQNELYTNILKYVPPYSEPYIKNQYSKWRDRAYAIRDFIQGDYQNLIAFNGNDSKWQCYQNAKDYIASCTAEVHYYITNVEKSLLLPAGLMCISNEFFMKKQSNFKNFCPVCLGKKVLRHSSEPVNKKGLIQYEGTLYWICSEHMSSVVQNPEKYLHEFKNIDIPEVPAIVKNIQPSKVYENGICIVTYAEHLPAQILKTGSYKFAASYKKQIYLFCDKQCLMKFLEKPHMYFDISVFKGTNVFPQISLKKLPNIGYLEQSVGEILTKACCAVNVVRPKYPGLSVELSGLLYVALYLKVYNPLSSEAAQALYKKIFKDYETRSKFIVNLGLRLRSMDNPLVSYPKCCKMLSKHSDSTVRKPTSSSSPVFSSLFPDARDDDETF